MGFDRESSSELSLTSLEATVAATTEAVENVTPIFAALLSIPTDDRYSPLDLRHNGRRMLRLQRWWTILSRWRANSQW